MKYRVFGPIEIPRDSDRFIKSNPEEVKAFFKIVDREKPGLSTARGVYLVALKNPRGMQPLYVGKAGSRDGFSSRVLQHDFLTNYSNNVTRPKRRGRPFVFFIARMNQTGSFSNHNKPKDIAWLEERIIERAFTAAPNSLWNKKSKKFWSQVEVPGVLNTPQGGLELASRELRMCLNLVDTVEKVVEILGEL